MSLLVVCLACFVYVICFSFSLGVSSSNYAPVKVRVLGKMRGYCHINSVVIRSSSLEIAKLDNLGEFIRWNCRQFM